MTERVMTESGSDSRRVNVQAAPGCGMMKAIVNVNRDWAIGRNGDLLVYIPEDMKYFRKTTAGAVVVMGRKTLESFPGGRPLKNRVNIVLTRDETRIPEASKEAADAYLSLPTADEFLQLMKRRAEALSAGTDPGTVLITVPSETALTELLGQTGQTDGTGFPDVYVIGGASIYRKLLPHCDTCLVTINDYKPEQGREADSWFPDLDAMAEWERTEEGKMQEHEGIHFSFCTYRRKQSI